LVDTVNDQAAQPAAPPASPWAAGGWPEGDSIAGIALDATGRHVVARSARGASGSCRLPAPVPAAAVARFAAEFLGQPLHAAPAGALARLLSLTGAEDRLAFAAVRWALGALREAASGELIEGGPVAQPAVLETGEAVPADPVAACREAGRTLLVADGLSAGGPEGLRELAALARAFDLQLAIRPAVPADATETARAATAAARLGAAVTHPPAAPAPIRPGGDGTVREVVLHRVSLPLRDPYVSAMYLTNRQPRTVVEMRLACGATGWGETNGAVAPLVAKLAAGWIGRDAARDRGAVRRDFARIGFDNRDGRNGMAAIAALDLAAWDAAARAAGLSLRGLLGDAAAGGEVAIACPLPAAAPGRLVSRAELAAHMADPGNAARVAELALSIAERWGVGAFKYKSTGTSAAWDLAVLAALRRALGPAARLRFDPNAAYATEAARRLCLDLEPLGLEFHEDPTDGLEGMARLAAALRTPLATNMCITAPEHLAAADRRPGTSVVLGDIFYWGGVAGLRDMAAVARLIGLTPALHSFYETGLATAANAAMALAFGLAERHPMDCGWPLLAEDIVAPEALRIAAGRLAAPEGPGLGLAPDPARLAALRTAEPQPLR
jgi:glucarate dehydratase